MQFSCTEAHSFKVILKRTPILWDESLFLLYNLSRKSVMFFKQNTIFWRIGCYISTLIKEHHQIELQKAFREFDLTQSFSQMHFILPWDNLNTQYCLKCDAFSFVLHLQNFIIYKNPIYVEISTYNDNIYQEYEW